MNRCPLSGWQLDWTCQAFPALSTETLVDRRTSMMPDDLHHGPELFAAFDGSQAWQFSVQNAGQ